ncbi:MAG: phosphotransferase [Anaerolineales bacterium]
MEEAIRQRFNEGILARARERYGISPEDIKLLAGFESFMYEFSKNGGDYILRLGHSRRRTPELIHGEVDWINYLADGGAGVARAILSERGELVEPIDDGRGGQFLATAFVKAKGDWARRAGCWDERLFLAYGRLLGRIHRLSKEYRPTNAAWKRPAWDDPIMQYAERYIPKDQELVLAAFRELLAYLQSLPQEREGFGMIHQDAHAGNFFVDENYNLTLFDFDDCVFGHFDYDLAMVVFYAVTNAPDPAAVAATLWPHFIKGYREENDLGSWWLASLPHFMKLREIDLYAQLLNVFGEAESGGIWIDSFMEGRRQRIEAGTPYLAFDFCE